MSAADGSVAKSNEAGPWTAVEKVADSDSDRAVSLHHVELDVTLPLPGGREHTVIRARYDGAHISGKGKSKGR